METLVLKAENFVIGLLNQKLDNKFLYHNIPHTQRVVEKATELAELSKLSPEDTEKLVIAAWFHDTGFTIDPANHEEKSIEIVNQFLKENNSSENFITDVATTILATKMDEVPNTNLGKLLKDADCSHVGSKNYDEFSQLLQKELELTTDCLLYTSDAADD